MPKSYTIAVIGAGVSGLCAARELLREGHRVVVFEKSERIGGTWVYDPLTDSDSLFDSGIWRLELSRQAVHGSLYSSLRTNLPRPLMGFSDYPFPSPEDCFSDARAFPAHDEVLAFIEAFASDSGVLNVVRLGAVVVGVARVGNCKNKWTVEWRHVAQVPLTALEKEVFDAVVICNGHHTQPRLAYIPGIEKWPGKQTHSHNYRNPEPFKDQVVVIIGRGSSSHDISRELSKLAKEVHMASRATDFVLGKLNGHDNIWQHLMINHVQEDGLVTFDDGSTVVADVILHCTGYDYSFPFLKGNEIVRIDDNRVEPLFKHIFPPHLAPWISFIGLPNKAIIFLMIELQSRWVAKVLSGKATLPLEEDMIASVKERYVKMEEMQRPVHHSHYIAPDEPEYLNWLASEVGLPPVEEWKQQMYNSVMEYIKSHEDGFRDSTDSSFWISKSTDLVKQR
ncbi:hypothetical protein HPP92_014586 [Vanilla planifolia]|uniref:Flavin-containing monooxygenase n=1 Tax=Vanilla planifolia TaxID=51239 RepID=A0A835QR89_VANPL|nr:hypothetical protein HPP92_014586 [Vanilla planifolia]